MAWRSRDLLPRCSGLRSIEHAHGRTGGGGCARAGRARSCPGSRARSSAVEADKHSLRHDSTEDADRSGAADCRDEAGPVVPAQPSTAPTQPAPGAAPLDFTTLVARLRATKAIGVLTKLSVKNQSDDLLEKFRAYHKRQGTASLADLHSAYEGLMLKLLALLQDGDPPLATDIDHSRAAIWDILADPMKFVKSNLMAGA